MRKISILFCLALITCIRLQGQLTVYPGDANNSHLANHVDLLYIGLNYGLTGPARNFFPNTNWTPQNSAPWGGPANLDPAYANCNGDTIIDFRDEAAIQQNFGLMHSGNILPDTSSVGSPNSPQLRLIVGPDSLLVVGTTQLTISVTLGSALLPIDSIYGYAFTIDYDPLIVDALSFSFTPGSFAIDSMGLQYVRIDTTLGKIYVSATNIDHQNRSGAGTIATIGIVMDDDIRISSMWNLLFTPSYFLGFSSSGSLVPIYPQGDTLVITGRPEPMVTGLDIYPNPATDKIIIQSKEDRLTGLKLYDVQGRLLLENAHPHANFEILNTDLLPSGCYFLEVHLGESILRRKMVIQPH